MEEQTFELTPRQRRAARGVDLVQNSHRKFVQLGVVRALNRPDLAHWREFFASFRDTSTDVAE